MALCDTCKVFSSKYDDFRINYDDVVDESQTQEKHYCVAYNDAIPDKIYYGGGDCPYYMESDST